MRKVTARALSLAAMLTTMVMPAPDSVAQNRGEILHKFKNGVDGARSEARLLIDSAGNLYGTASQGGNGSGVAFQLTPTPVGGWTGSILHNFGSEEGDGTSPVAGLTFDEAGNLYGTTTGGGANGDYGRGTVFKLTPSNNGWRETILYSFCPLGVGHCSDGDGPDSDLIFDSAGNLYGTTGLGGKQTCRSDDLGCGVIYRLSPGPDGTWTEKVLHYFSGKDGQLPVGGLIFDTQGNLFGATDEGGNLPCSYELGCGVVFELTPNPDDTWTYHVLHRFTTSNGGGVFPNGALVFDSTGSLYGVGAGGGTPCGISQYGCGLIFQLTSAGDTWTEKVVHRFTGNDGGIPRGRLVFDSMGNLYGATTGGGDPSCVQGYGCGTVFELKSNGGGRPKHYVLRFNGRNGALPFSSPIIGRDGNLYGTTYLGGIDDWGVVYEVFAPLGQRE